MKKKKEISTFQRRLNRQLDKSWKKLLASEGDILLTGNPDAMKPSKLGVKWIYTCVNRTYFLVGGRSVVKKLQRSFQVGKPTRVPKILSKSFLSDPHIIEWHESMSPLSDEILDAEVLEF